MSEIIPVERMIALLCWGFYPTATVVEGSHLFQGPGWSRTLFSVGFYHSATVPKTAPYFYSPGERVVREGGWDSGRGPTDVDVAPVPAG